MRVTEAFLVPNEFDKRSNMFILETSSGLIGELNKRFQFAIFLEFLFSEVSTKDKSN